MFFVNDTPTDAQIAALAAALGPTMDIAALLRTMLTDPAFWDSRYATVRSPIEFVVDVLRRTGIRADESGIEWQMDGMGQGLFAPPSVAGWGVNGHWVNTKVAWGKARFVNQLRWNEDYHRRFDDILDEPDAHRRRRPDARLLRHRLGVARDPRRARATVANPWQAAPMGRQAQRHRRRHDVPRIPGRVRPAMTNDDPTRPTASLPTRPTASLPTRPTASLPTRPTVRRFGFGPDPELADAARRLHTPPDAAHLDRRRFLQGMLAVGGVAALGIPRADRRCRSGAHSDPTSASS